MNMERSILAYAPPQDGAVSWWEFWTGRIFVRVPEEVKRRLAIAKAAHGIANQLAPLDPDANREILYQAGALLGVLNEKEEVR
jgi:hypothetical protein